LILCGELQIHHAIVGKSIPNMLDFGLGHTVVARVCARGHVAAHPETTLPTKLLW